MASLAGCGLPRSGPSPSELIESSIQKSGDAYVVLVDNRVAKATAPVPAPAFPSQFVHAPVIAPDRIRVGDTLALTVFESVDIGLLAGADTNAAALQAIQVDGDGFIFVPYAGRILAAGKTPEELRRIITEKLADVSPDPQVLVNRTAGDGATVSVAGGVGKQGVYPIERPNRTLTAMLATAGGVSVPPEVARITILRGRQRGQVWFEDVYEHPEFDVALRNGDRILVERDTRSFTALGATVAQRRIPFEKQTLTAVEAIAQVGGLATNLANPKGVFILRNEPAGTARAVVGSNDLTNPQRVVYVLDLTQPTGIFLAREFMIRDGDTVYVSEAPYVSLMKALSIVSGSLAPLNSAQNLGQ
ncbi:Capsule polysaccharide export protein [Rhodovulum sp. P5]|uniref:polysaccharide biosynthesis/export family protein n=1 Tax=Rhodovulum sp. P5 TaxID=1564506 RepID=UPI0009C38E70|nr:polysaccharide biosynthesis/export family protein [Rhodovulum sp. P5]ARE40081.1 Capsule polysaccharide export protein [Rhodovulum sp. P5]